MTRTMNTIPDEAVPLKAAKKSKSSNAKSILAAAATVSFIFGLLAATAVTPAPTRAAVAFDSQDLGRGQAVAAAVAGAANVSEDSESPLWSHLETQTVGPTLTATKSTAIALANKGMDVRYVYGLDACHTDVRLQLEQRVPALIWAMAPWKEKLAAKKLA